MATRIALACIVLALGSPTATAQQVGSATGGPATADGASAFNNPAAMSAGEGTMLELVGGMSFIDITYTPDSVTYPSLSPSAPTPVGPFLTLGGYTDAIHEDWRLGITATIPETQGGAFDREDGAGSITRYFMVNSALAHFSVVPAASWSPVEWFSVGLGVNVTIGNLNIIVDKDMAITLNESANESVMSPVVGIPFPYAHPDLAAPIDGSATGAGVGVVGGLFFRPIEQLSIGLSIHSPVSIQATGSLTVEYPDRVRQFVDDLLPGATLPPLNGDFDLDLSRPLRFGIGVSAYVIPALEIGLNYTYENTKSQPNFNIVITEATSPSITDTTKPQAYFDRHRVGLRVAYLPVPVLRLVVFGSFQSNTIPLETFAPYNIDFNRYELGLMARWHVIPELSVALQLSHIFLVDRVIPRCAVPPEPPVPCSLHRPLTQASLAAFNHPSPTGAYNGGATTLRLGLGAHF